MKGGATSGETRLARNLRCDLEKLVGIEENGDGAVVGEFEKHMGLKNSGFDRDAQSFRSLNELFVEGFAKFGRRGLNEAWAALPASVSVESELRDGEQRAAHVEQREVHFSLLVVEDPEPDDFVGHRDGGFGRVVASHGNQGYKALADFAGHTSIHQDAGFTDALDHGPHLMPGSFAAADCSLTIKGAALKRAALHNP